MGLAVFDRGTARVEELRTVEVFAPNRYACDALYGRLFEVLADYLDGPWDAVVVEQQFDTAVKMSKAEGCIAGMFVGRGHNVVVLAPRTVKMRLGVAMGNYRANKEAACDWLTARLTDGTYAHTPALDAWERMRQRERFDMADAMLLIHFYVHVYEPPA